jgi:hypothetical protein
MKLSFMKLLAVVRFSLTLGFIYAKGGTQYECFKSVPTRKGSIGEMVLVVTCISTACSRRDWCLFLGW